MGTADRTAWADGVIALFYTGLFVWAVSTGTAAAEAAVQDYGYNIDSGAIQFLVAIFYFGPLAVLFGLAAASLFRCWRVKWYLHWFAVFCAVSPFFIPGVAFVPA